MEFPKIKDPKRLPEKVSALLEESILNGKFARKERLPSESALANAFGVSRAVIREATQNLKAQGLIEARTGSGNYVKDFGNDQIAKVFERFGILHPDRDVIIDFIDLRMLIELESVRLLVEKHDRVAIGELLRVVEQMGSVVNKDLKAYSTLDTAFHLTLARSSGNLLYPILLEPIRRLGLRYGVTKAPQHDRLDKHHGISYEDHKAIFQSINRRDLEGAVSRLKEHIDRSKRTYLERVAGVFETKF